MTRHARLQDAHQLRLSIQRVRFSTEDLPERDPAGWRKVIGRNLVRLDLKPLSNRPLRSDVSLYALPGRAKMRGEISDRRIAGTRGGIKAFRPVLKSPRYVSRLIAYSYKWMSVLGSVFVPPCCGSRVNARFAPAGMWQNGFERVRKCSRSGARHGDLLIRTLSAGSRN